MALGGARPIPTPAPTLALAVPRGEGDVIRSLLSLSFEAEDMDIGTLLASDDCSGCDGGAGDFRVDDVDGIDSVAGGGADMDVGGNVDVNTANGVSNSTGLVRGVACTLVINFALEQ